MFSMGKLFQENAELQRFHIEIINEQPFATLCLAVQDPGEACCVFVDDKAFVEKLSSSVTMCIVTREVADALPTAVPYGLVITDMPRAFFFALHGCMASLEGYKRKDTDTVIGKHCSISALASVAEKNVVIEDGVVIEEFAVVREHTRVGKNAIIRAGAVIGGAGFECKLQENGTIAPVAHLGGVAIGSHVEIQYNSCVDRAIYPWDDTIIGDYCKIDNLVYIAHAVKIARGVMIAAGSTIGGRVEIGEDAWVGLGAVVRNGIKLGENSRANMGAVVTLDVPPNKAVSGNFATDHAQFLLNLTGDGKRQTNK
jgi:acyl-[acyl carrier protein]--UDP-N-acetylglucosamine O-acyltransferase